MAPPERADLIFAALGDRTRRDILSLVLVGEHSVSGLARRFPMSFAAVQKHVAVLERAGLVVKRHEGREQRVSGNLTVLQEAQRLLEELECLCETVSSAAVRSSPGRRKEHDGDRDEG